MQDDIYYIAGEQSTWRYMATHSDTFMHEWSFILHSGVDKTVYTYVRKNSLYKWRKENNQGSALLLSNFVTPSLLFIESTVVRSTG